MDPAVERSAGILVNSLTPPAGEPIRSVDLTQFSDEELVERVAAQDVEALDALYGRHARATYSLAYRVLNDRELAEDVVQESFLTLWQRPDAFVPQRGRLLTWLLGVTHHRAIDVVRRRNVEVRHRQDGASANEVLDRSPTADPESQAWHSQRSATVSKALSVLPRNQREALELAYFGGLTQTEIAARLDQPLGTVKTRIRLAMQKLRTSSELQGLHVE
jgi:RNA polymerase sigma-70 factor, ECF subfamily